MAAQCDDEQSEDNVPDEVNQREINNAWIKQLDRNYPLKTYYKALKKNILILLASERICSRKYPEWSEDLYNTITQVAEYVPEIKSVIIDLGIGRECVMQSAYELQSKLTQAQKYKLARFISQTLVIEQRDYICKLSVKEDFTGLDLDSIKAIFDSANIYEVRADLDAFLFLSEIAE